MTAALALLDHLPDDNGATPLWSEIIGAMPPAHRRVALEYMIERDRQAREARAEAERLRQPPSRADRIRARDNAIRAVLTAVYADMPPSAGAKALARDLDRYASGAWARERDLAELPAGSSDLRRATHRILRLSDGRVLGWRRLLQIGA